MTPGKRLHYSDSDSTNSESDSDYKSHKVLKSNYLREEHVSRRSSRQPKSFSRNALMARENRLKKKMYMENLEKELTKEKVRIKKMNAMLKEQTSVIEKQEKDIKYLRSILANSTDISRLLRSIHTNTGMCVGTSINQNLSFKNDTNGIHPWDDPSLEGFSPFPASEDDFDITSALNIPDDILLQEPSPTSTLEEHNYTLASDQKEDVGVCLHISKHKVALEFCASCNDNANQAWMQDNV